MEKMAYKVKGTCSTGHIVEKLSINFDEARKIVSWFSKNIDWITKRSEVNIFSDRKRLLGDFDSLTGNIRLFGYKGATVGTLLHELCHFVTWNHDNSFRIAYEELTEMWDVFEEDIFPPAYVSNLSEVIEYLIENAEDTKVITKFEIGSELSEENLHTNENLNFVMKEIKKLGYVVR